MPFVFSVMTRPAPPWIAPLAVAVLAFVAHAASLANGFVFDDHEYLFDDALVRQGLTWAGFVKAWTAFYAANWHPLTTLSFMADASLFGRQAWGYHLTNVLWHAVSAAVLCTWCRRATESGATAFVAAALFAVHPIHVESVAWISERKDVLSGFFWNLAILAYVARAERPARFRMVPVCLCMLAGLLSKQMVVTLPCALLLLDWWPLGRRLSWRLVAEKAPLFLLAAGFCVVALAAQKAGGAVSSTATLPLPQRFANATISLAAYPGKGVWPSELMPFYDLRLEELTTGRIALAVVVLVSITAAALLVRRRFPAALFGWGWYVVTILPVIGIIQIGSQSMADRYAYIPFIGLYVAAGTGYAGLQMLASSFSAGRWKRRAAGLPAVILAAVLAACASATVAQTRLWRDGETLWGYVLQKDPANWMAHRFFTGFYQKKGEPEKALAHCEWLITNSWADAIVWADRAAALTILGLRKEALDSCHTAIRMDPTLTSPLITLGKLRLPADPAGAMEFFQQALRIDPDNAAALTNVGALLAGEDPAAAETCYRQAIDAQPENPEALSNYGNLLARRGELARALDFYRQALAARPGFADAAANMAKVEEMLARQTDSANRPDRP